MLEVKIEELTKAVIALTELIGKIEAGKSEPSKQKTINDLHAQAQAAEVIKPDSEVMEKNSGTGVNPEIIFTGKYDRTTLGKNSLNSGSIIMKYSRYIIMDRALLLNSDAISNAKHIYPMAWTKYTRTI